MTGEEDTAAELPLRQQRFVSEYLVDLNGTKAAIRAGYSENGARVQASRMLANVSVQEAIAEGAEARSERTQINQDRVVLELARLAFSDIGDHLGFGPDGVTLKDLAEMPEAARRCVAEVSENKNSGSLRFKLHPKLPAIEALLKHLDNTDLDDRLRAIEERLGAT